jgi:hypothetical protein
MIEDFPAILKTIFDPNYDNIRFYSQSMRAITTRGDRMTDLEAISTVINGF